MSTNATESVLNVKQAKVAEVAWIMHHSHLWGSVVIAFSMKGKLLSWSNLNMIFD